MPHAFNMKLQHRLYIIIVVVLAIFAVMVITRRSRRIEGFQPAFNAEFLTRPDGYQGLRQHYDLQFPVEPIQMADSMMYKALADGMVDVIDAFSTDGRIAAYDLFVLQDDKKYFPPYYAAPIVRNETLQRIPRISTILNRLGGQFSDHQMQQLNFAVDEKGYTVNKVAEEFLRRKNLIPAEPVSKQDSLDAIVVGGKEFTEQEIIGEIIALMLDYHLPVKVVRKLNLGGTMIAFNALKAGDIDVYAEYTGTGLVTILKEPVTSDPDQVYSIVKRKFLDDYNISWLEPFGFNNTYTLTVRKSTADQLGIKTISDLATYLKKNDAQPRPHR